MSDTAQFSDRKVLLFLSVDIIGSTEYKNKSLSQYHWLKFFKTFYEDFPIFFIRKIEELGPVTIKPTIWKSLGDEIIFQCEINNHQTAQTIVKAFSKAVFEYSSKISEKSVALKGAAWIAGFPVINAMISSNSDNDYIGPQIDIGFRISKFATEAKFIVSVELMLILSKTNDIYFKFYLEEPQSLKGVLKNKPYPIIWIKNESAKEIKLNLLLSKHVTHVDKDQLQDYCTSFIREAGQPFMIPFLSKDSLFSELPEWYEEEYNRIKQILFSSEEELSKE